MKNMKTVINQRLSDPRFQTRMLIRCTWLCIALTGLILLAFSFEFISWFIPENTPYFLIDGKNNPVPIVASDIPPPPKVKNENSQ